MRGNWHWAAIAILVFSPKVGLAQTPVDRALIGVLEEVPGVYAGELSHFGVRAAFEHTSGGWHTLPHDCANPACLVAIAAEYPQETRWTISSGGRILGSVIARTPADFAFYAQVGIQTVPKTEKVPTLGAKSIDYSGFAETLVQRPLLATSGSAKAGPAQGHWMSAAPDARDVRIIWPLFQRSVLLIDDCRLDARGEFIPSSGRAPKLEEFEIAGKWVSRSGDALLHARIRPNAFSECDGPMSHRSAYWYYRQRNGAVRLLPGQDSFVSDPSGPYAELAMPLEFVDILGDGHDVALFLMAGYDAGGYALFYDGFQRVSTFQWIYH